MSNDKYRPNIYDRIWKLRAMIDKMIMDGVRDPETFSKILQDITGDDDKSLPIHVYDRLLRLWYKVYDMIERGDCNPEKVANTLQAVVDEKAYIHRLFVNDVIILDATDGTKTLVELMCKEEQWMPERFVEKLTEWGINLPGKATIKTPIAVYEIVKDGTFRKIFGNFFGNLSRCCWQQSQIVEFCLQHIDRFAPKGVSNFFLFTKAGEPILENESNLFVAGLSVSGLTNTSLRVSIERFSANWDPTYISKNHPRLFVPLDDSDLTLL